MVEGHIVIAMPVCLFVCVFPESYPIHTLSYIVGFENHFAQMIIMIRQCATCKNHVTMGIFDSQLAFAGV